MSALADRLREIHSARTETAEVWIDGPGEETHRELFSGCTDCEGHEVEVQVCSECGYEHDGDTAVYRAWPCPTLLAVVEAEVIEPEEGTRP